MGWGIVGGAMGVSVLGLRVPCLGPVFCNMNTHKHIKNFSSLFYYIVRRRAYILNACSANTLPCLLFVAA
jgi:hypothetical protein